MPLFSPTVYRRRITDIRPEELRRRHIDGVLLDIDNTLTTHDNPALDPAVADWLARMQAEGVRLVIVSNNHPARVAPFADAIGLPYYAEAGKPLPRGYREAVKVIGVPVERCAAVGDQIFTDILGANLAGMTSYLLEPIEPEVEQKFIVFKRRFERLLLRRRRAIRQKEADYRE